MRPWLGVLGTCAWLTVSSALGSSVEVPALSIPTPPTLSAPDSAVSLASECFGARWAELSEADRDEAAWLMLGVRERLGAWWNAEGVDSAALLRRQIDRLMAKGGYPLVAERLRRKINRASPAVGAPG